MKGISAKGSQRAESDRCDLLAPDDNDGFGARSAFRFAGSRHTQGQWLLSRHLVRSQIRIWLAAGEICPGTVNRRIILELIARQSLGRGLSPPTDGERSREIGGLSINAMAASLDAPFETVRRHVHALIEQGVCCVIDGRCVLRPRPERSDIVQRYQDSLVQEAKDLIDHFQAAEALPFGSHDLGDVSAEALAAAALDISLVAVENNRTQIANWYEMILVGGLLTLNVEHISADHRASAVYRDSLLGDELRKPVSCTELSQFLGLPYHTVRRQLMQSLDRGVVELVARGYITPASFVCNQQSIEIGQQSVRYALNRLRRLTQEAPKSPNIAEAA